MGKSSNTPATIKLEAEDEFVFKLKYGNFTKAKHGYSLDGSIKVKDGDSVKSARIYISRSVRDQIIAEWPGREGLITGKVVSENRWEILEVTESEYAKYGPQLWAWNNDPEQFEEIAWDEEDGAAPAQKGQPAKVATKASPALAGDSTYADIIVLFGATWDAAGALPIGAGEKTLDDCGTSDGVGLDVRYKAAFSLFKEARMAKVMPDETPEAQEDQDAQEDDGGDEDDDLPF